MTFFLDFDRTLFDTERFYAHLEQSLLMPSQYLAHADSLEEFLYPDTIPFLRAHAKDALVLVTRGIPELQRLKAEKSGVLEHIPDALYVEDGTKADAIRAYLVERPLQPPAYFLDDVVSEHEAVRELLPQITAIRMRRPSAATSDLPGPRMPELAGLAEFSPLLETRL